MLINHYLSRMHQKFCFSLLVFGIQILPAQEKYPASVTDTLTEPADFARNFYYGQRGNEAAIYNGALHYAYFSSIEGIAYFNSADWQKGSVVYEGIRYQNILMKYDLVKDQLVVAQSESGGLPISLNSFRVSEFSFLNYQFIRVDTENPGQELRAGFYRLLSAGKVLALARTEKTISERIVDNKVVQRFETKTRYYISRGDQYYKIKNKNDLFRILDDHKNELHGFIRENKLNYRKIPERTITEAVNFYNKL